MSLQVNFPKNRKYYFWAIMLCHIMSVEPSILDAERKLFGTLAYRMISKAAESVPADPVCSQSGTRKGLVLTRNRMSC